MKKITMIFCLFLGLTVAAFAQKPAHSTEAAEKAKELQQQLKLSDKQTSQVTAIYAESAKKFDEIKAKEKGNNDKMLMAIKPLRASTVKKIKAVLKPEQITAYEKMVSSKTKQSAGWSDGWSAGL